MGTTLWTEDRKRAVLEAHAAGKPILEIAAMAAPWGVTLGGVKRVIDRAGAKRAPGGARRRWADEDRRRAWALFAIEGRPLAEVASALGCSWESALRLIERLVDSGGPGDRPTVRRRCICGCGRWFDSPHAGVRFAPDCARRHETTGGFLEPDHRA